MVYEIAFHRRHFGAEWAQAEEAEAEPIIAKQVKRQRWKSTGVHVDPSRIQNFLKQKSRRRLWRNTDHQSLGRYISAHD
jgi:hypothetical protein